LAVGSDAPLILLIREVIPPVVTVAGIPVFTSNGAPVVGSIGDTLVPSVDVSAFDSTAGVGVSGVKIAVEGTEEQALHG
jgi:hypothetical protein